MPKSSRRSSRVAAKAAKDEADSLERQKDLCRAAINRDDWREVERLCTDVIEHYPDSSALHEFYAERSLAMSKLGDYEDALRDADWAILLNPKDAYAHLHRGVALSEMYRRDNDQSDEPCSLEYLEQATASMHRGIDLDPAIESEALEMLSALEKYKLRPEAQPDICRDDAEAKGKPACIFAEED